MIQTGEGDAGAANPQACEDEHLAIRSKGEVVILAAIAAFYFWRSFAIDRDVRWVPFTAFDPNSWWGVMLVHWLIAVGCLAYIARGGMYVDRTGITLRYVLRRRHIPWSDVAAIRLTKREAWRVQASVVLTSGSVRVAPLTGVYRREGRQWLADQVGWACALHPSGTLPGGAPDEAANSATGLAGIGEGLARSNVVSVFGAALIILVTTGFLDDADEAAGSTSPGGSITVAAIVILSLVAAGAMVPRLLSRSKRRDWLEVELLAISWLFAFSAFLAGCVAFIGGAGGSVLALAAVAPLGLMVASIRGVAPALSDDVRQ